MMYYVPIQKKKRRANQEEKKDTNDGTRNQRLDIADVPREMKITIGENWELYANKLDNLDEMENF